MKLCKDIDIHDNMIVYFRNKNCSLGYAINNCKSGEPIQGVHPNQYKKMILRFEKDRGKKFQYSVDIRYNDWRFILFDESPKEPPKTTYSIFKLTKPLAPRVIQIFKNCIPIS